VPRKILVTGTTGLLAFLVTTLAQQETIWAIVMATFIGGVTLVVQFLIDFDKSLQRVEIGQEQHAESIERLVREGFANINKATQLFGLIEASAVHTELVTQLVIHSTQIGPAMPSLVSNFAQAEMARMSDFLKELTRGGDVTYDGEDRDWLLSLTRSAGISIDATSLTTVDAGATGFVDGGLWTSDLGQQYLEAQRDAIERGVVIRRVFIVDRPELVNDPGLREIAGTHQMMGIHVRVLAPGAIPPTRRTSLFDFILFDDVMSYEVTPASRIEDTMQPSVVHTRLVLRDLRVKERIQRFRDLWESAREFSDKPAGQ
jgi:hypothetical protein